MDPSYRPVAAAALVFVAGFGALTIADVVSNGPTILSALSLLILAMLGFGIGGALREPPE